MIDFEAALRALTDAGVRFIIVGGAARTALSDVDLLGEIIGGGQYDRLSSHTVELELFGVRCLCLDLPTLVAVKRAAGRPKDLEAIAELEALLQERGPD